MRRSRVTSTRTGGPGSATTPAERRQARHPAWSAGGPAPRGVRDVPIELRVNLLDQAGAGDTKRPIQDWRHQPLDDASLARAGRRSPHMEDRPAGRGLELPRLQELDRADRGWDGVPQREVVVGTPVEELLDARPLAVHAVVRGPDTPAVAGRDDLHPAHTYLPGGSSTRRGHVFPQDLRRDRRGEVLPVDRLAVVDDDARATPLPWCAHPRSRRRA